MAVQYPMVKGLSHILPLLLGTLFLNRSDLLTLCLLSDPELKLTFSILPINFVDLSVVSCLSQSFLVCVLGELGSLSMFCNCNKYFVVMFCNNVF